jgi:hypothetical protein
MKRILTVLAVLVSFAAAAQIPGSTTVNSRYDWLGGHFKQLKLPAYADTTDVPDWAPWLSGDAMLDTSGGNAGTIYVRYGSPRKWHAVSGSGGSGGGISEWIAGFGLLQVNDSTGAVDTSLITSRDRMYQQRDSLLALINLRMKYTDTASALSGYVRVGRFLDSLTAHQTRIQTKVAFTDTAAQTAGYTRVTRFLDSLTNHQTRIQTKVAFTDTATQMSGYVRKNRNLAVGYGILGGGDLNANRTFTADTATLFPAVRATVPSSSGGTTSLTGIRDSLLNPQDWKARITYRLDASYIDTLRGFGNSIDNHYNVTRGYNDQAASMFGMSPVILASNGTGTHYSVGAINNNLQVWTRALVLVGGLGFNEIRTDSSAITFSKIGQAYRSILLASWTKTFYAASAMTQSGTWTGFNGQTSLAGKAGGAAGGQSAFNNVSGSTLSQTFTGTGVGVAYYSSIVGGFNGGEIDITLDGTVIHHEVLNKTNSTNTQTPGAWFITGLANTSHTITITNTTNNYVYIDYVGVLRDPGDANPVLLMGISKLNTTGYAATLTQANDRNFTRGDDTVKAVIHEAAGYPARFVPTTWTLNTSTDIQSDSIHPNEVGHYHLLQNVAENITRHDAPLASQTITRGLVANSYQLFYGQKGVTGGGFMVFGDNTTRPSGGHVDIIYSGSGYVRALNGTTPTGLIMGGSILTYQISNVTAFDIDASYIPTFQRGLKINQGGASTPTLIGTNGNANSFYLRANDGNLGLNTNNPISKLHVNGSGRFADSLILARSAVVGTSADSLLGRNTTTGQVYTLFPASSLGIANANVGSAFRILQPTAQTMKTVAAGIDIIIDSATANTLTFHADTTTGATNLATQGDITRAISTGSYTFSTGLTNTSSTITNNLSTGVSGGQTAIGGTGATDVLNIHATSANTTGTGIALNIGAKNTAGVPTESITINNAGMVGILTGASTPTSNLQVNGSFAWVTSSVNQDLTMDASVMMWRVDASGANRTITLPATPANFIGRVYIIKKSDSSGNTVTIVGTINGTANRVLNTQHTGYILISNGTDWDIIGSF